MEMNLETKSRKLFACGFSGFTLSSFCLSSISDFENNVLTNCYSFAFKLLKINHVTFLISIVEQAIWLSFKFNFLETEVCMLKKKMSYKKMNKRK